jgi:hypothetical protein
MSKISLKSIQNKAINPDKKMVTIKSSQKIETPNNDKKLDFNMVLTEIQKNGNKQVHNHGKTVKQTKQHDNTILPQENAIVHNKELSEHERNKLIGLLHLYIAEFPEKLKEYKGKNFHKMDNNKLLELKDIFKKEVTTSNNLTMAVETSVKMLEMYEFACCNFGVNIKGVSKIGQSEEYKQTVKAVLLKYFDNSLISQVEPEYKLAYLIVSNSLICHQLNTMNETTEKINNIEKPMLTHNMAPQNIEPVNEDTKRIKDMQLRDINGKFSDL